METFFAPSPMAQPVSMEGLGAWAMLVLFVILPWLVILVDALFLGFDLVLSLAMLLLFGMGMVFLAATAEAA